ncbi:MAG: hypothetical protein JXR88_16945 [Clostridia bacterium]|nr:hypothetical protein [Clostridia bacterium]
MEVLSKKELKKVILSVDGYNDYGFDTFSENLMDYCDEITDADIVDIIDYIEEEYEITSDADLREISDDQLLDLCDFINDLFD